MSRYSLTRTPKYNKLWQLALAKPDSFYNIAYLLRVSMYVIQSNECICGMFAYDIVNRFFYYCKQTQQQRDYLIDSVIDLLDVNTFVSLWNDDDDVLLSFLLGGMPTNCAKNLNEHIWEDIIMLVKQGKITLWNVISRWKNHQHYYPKNTELLSVISMLLYCIQ